MKIIWCASASLDGFIADTNGKCDWITPDDDEIWSKLAHQAKAVIVGRRTFNQFYGEIFPVPKATTYVLTTDATLRSEDPSVVYMAGGAMELMRRLSADGHSLALLAGGGEAAGLFAAANLIDEAWISVYPMVVGAGTRLLGPYEGGLRLTLQQGYALAGGIVHNRYEVG